MKLFVLYINLRVRSTKSSTLKVCKISFILTFQKFQNISILEKKRPPSQIDQILVYHFSGQEFGMKIRSKIKGVVVLGDGSHEPVGRLLTETRKVKGPS